MTTSRYIPLEIATSTAQITDLAENMHNGNPLLPGFQIHERLTTEGVLNILEIIENASGTQYRQGRPVLFNTISDVIAHDDHHIPPHIDGVYAGLAVHHTRSYAGEGKVELAYLDDREWQPGDEHRLFTAPNQTEEDAYMGRGIIDIAETTRPSFWQPSAQPSHRVF